jgi:peroxiredoxin
MTALRNGDRFPSLSLAAVGGGRIALPDDLAGSYGVVLFYRGSWCPYCNAQLAAFARAGDTLAALGIRVVALSVDDAATSAALAEKVGLRFPVGYGADATAIAAATGAYTNDAPSYLQSTGFVLDPAGRVLVAVYSSGAIGRLVAEDVAGYVRYLQSHP